MRSDNFMTKVSVGALSAAALVITMSAEVELGRDDNMGVDLSLAVPPAEARVGRPATPLSVAGVTRRTTRRTVARTTYYSALPAGCYWRAPYHYCGGVYYEPVVQNGSTSYIIVNP